MTWQRTSKFHFEQFNIWFIRNILFWIDFNVIVGEDGHDFWNFQIKLYRGHFCAVKEHFFHYGLLEKTKWRFTILEINEIKELVETAHNILDY